MNIRALFLLLLVGPIGISSTRCTVPTERTIVGVTQSAPTPQRRSKPNILLILADDLGHEVLSCYGGRSYKTPNLDRLATTGARFTRAYATPYCTTTRVELMTGQYPARNGWDTGIWNLPRNRQVLDPATFTFARMLKQAGYATGIYGKWQLARFDDHPNHLSDCGFDEHCVWTWEYRDSDEPRRAYRYWQPALWRNGRLASEFRRDNVYGPDVVSDHLLDFIRRHKDQPFFAYYPMILPHPPFVPTPDVYTPANKSDRFPKQENNTTQPKYYGPMVSYMDKIVGRIADELDGLGLRENTLIIFAGDNGTPQVVTSLFHGHLMHGEKTQLTDLGTHVPLIVNWKGMVTAGQVRNELVDMTDVLPTLAQVSDGSVPSSHALDGRSFLPFLFGEAGNPRTWIMCQYERERFVMDDRYRLHSNTRLYDITNLPDVTILWPPSKSVQEDLSKDATAARDRLQKVMEAYPTRRARQHREAN